MLSISNGSTFNYLVCHDRAAAEYLESCVDPRDVLQWDRSYWSSAHSLQHLPVPDLGPLPPIRVGTLWWPSDDSRFAIANVLVDDTDLTALRPIIYSTNGPLPIIFTMDEAETASGLPGNGAANIGATMYCLPARPLAQITGSNGLYLLTMVDSRYFDWLRCVDVVPSSTWASYLSSICSTLGGTSSVSTPNSLYGNPSNRLTVRRQPLPLLLDAAARTCGLRVSKSLTGTRYVESYGDALDRESVEVAKIKENCTSADVKAGKFQPLSGGIFDYTDVNRGISVPATVTVIFGATDNGAFRRAPYTRDITLAGLVIGGLSEFTGVTGFVGNKPIVADLTAVFTVDPVTPDNLTTLIDYAAAAATDYYLWQLGTVDTTITGIAAYDSNSLVDYIEWRYVKGMCSTRIVRKRWQDREMGMYRQSGLEGYLSAWPEGQAGTKGQANTLPVPALGPRLIVNLKEDNSTPANTPVSNTLGENLKITIADNPGTDSLDWTLNDLGVFGRANTTGTTYGPRRRLNLVQGSGIGISVTDPGADDLTFTISNTGSTATLTGTNVPVVVTTDVVTSPITPWVYLDAAYDVLNFRANVSNPGHAILDVAVSPNSGTNPMVMFTTKNTVRASWGFSDGGVIGDATPATSYGISITATDPSGNGWPGAPTDAPTTPGTLNFAVDLNTYKRYSNNVYLDVLAASISGGAYNVLYLVDDSFVIPVGGCYKVFVRYSADLGFTARPNTGVNDGIISTAVSVDNDFTPGGGPQTSALVYNTARATTDVPAYVYDNDVYILDTGPIADNTPIKLWASILSPAVIGGTYDFARVGDNLTVGYNVIKYEAIRYA